MTGILIIITAGMMGLMKWISIQQDMGGNFTRAGMIQDPSSVGGTVLLLTVIVAAGIVASEFSQGTIKMLLTRPVKRWKILLSKFLTVNVFGMFLMVIGYAVYVLLALLLFKSGAGESISSWSVWSKSL